MKTVTSKDGTSIAYDQVGNGPAVILVTGALGVRSDPIVGELAQHLAHRFTVINYDRRGRGDSSDTAPYSVQREVEDIEALIDAAGGSASLYGFSSGGVLALEAAARLPGKVKKLVMYEPPFIVDDSRPPLPKDYVQRLNQFVAQGRRGDAVELFMTEAVGVPAEFVAQMKADPDSQLDGDGEMMPPMWAAMEAVAHTLAYDGMIMGDTMSGKPLPAGRWNSNTAPTLVISGGNSEAFMHDGAKAVAAALPNARHQVLPGQDHNVAPDAISPMVEEFLSE